MILIKRLILNVNYSVSETFERSLFFPQRIPLSARTRMWIMARTNMARMTLAAMTMTNG